VGTPIEPDSGEDGLHRGHRRSDGVVAIDYYSATIWMSERGDQDENW